MARKPPKYSRDQVTRIYDQVRRRRETNFQRMQADKFRKIARKKMSRRYNVGRQMDFFDKKEAAHKFTAKPKYSNVKQNVGSAVNKAFKHSWVKRAYRATLKGKIYRPVTFFGTIGALGLASYATFRDSSRGRWRKEVDRINMSSNVYRLRER